MSALPDAAKACADCDGEPVAVREVESAVPHGVEIVDVCPTCDGKGYGFPRLRETLVGRVKGQ